MEPYQNLSGDSGVAAYELGDDFIQVEFRSGAIYLYTHDSAGRAAVERMKELARAGQGLNSYINREVKQRYAEKLR